MVQSTRVFLSAVLVGFGFPLAAQAQIEGPNELPDGEGKNLVQGICTACHEVTLITGSVGYTQDEWRYLFGHMINLAEPIAVDISEYLAANFPPSGERKPVLVPGDTVVSFKEWVAPTLGQRPRDPFMHTDGTIWWAGMYGSLVGRLDPATGEMKEYRLDPTARPHSVTEGPDGDVWYSGNSNGTIGRIDRETGEITVYPLNNAAARDPHTMAFAGDGALWFTVQNSNMLGRLDPATGDVWLRDIPTERARPYGIRRDSEGMLWIAYRGAYKIARVNPATKEITEFETPNYGKYPGMGYYVRRLAIDSQDNVWYVDSGRGEIGRFNPKSEEFKQWPSPSGVASHPYAIEVIDDIVWYNESDVRPDTLVRFDPKTEKFQSWPIPSGVGIIRNMSKTPDGNLVIHQSSTNTVGLALIGEENIAKYSEMRVSQR
jgi:virginiamycin B lyase